MKRIGMGVMALVALLVAWLLLKPEAEEAPNLAEQTPAAAVPKVQIQEAVAVEVIRGTAFDTRFAAADTTAHDDLMALRGIIDDAILLVKDFPAHPLADNADFVTFLSGKNPHGVAWIRPDHPSLSATGELLDRWGRPIFFHRESATRTSLRSAGPDRQMWTGDDVMLENPVPE